MLCVSLRFCDMQSHKYSSLKISSRKLCAVHFEVDITTNIEPHPITFARNDVFIWSRLVWESGLIWQLSFIHYTYPIINLCGFGFSLDILLSRMTSISAIRYTTISWQCAINRFGWSSLSSGSIFETMHPFKLDRIFENSTHTLSLAKLQRINLLSVMLH